MSYDFAIFIIKDIKINPQCKADEDINFKDRTGRNTAPKVSLNLMLKLKENRFLNRVFLENLLK